MSDDPRPGDPLGPESEAEGPVQAPAGAPAYDQVELPDTLPVLPLRNTVLFPALVTPMVATTGRAKRLVEDVAGGSRILVAVAARDAEIESPGPDDVYRVGTAVRVLRMVQNPDGGQRIWVQGLRRVRIEDFVATEPYLTARISAPGSASADPVEVEALQRNVARMFLQYAEGAQVSEPVTAMVQGLEDPAALSDVVAANLGLPTEERQKLLEMFEVRARLEYLSEHLAREQEVKRL